MAVDSAHSQYTAHLDQWLKARDAAAGQEAVHARGKKYLPKLGGQDHQEYEAYKQRALFYGATGRTIDGLSGMIFRKEPQSEIPAGLEEFTTDVNLEGVDLRGFAEDLVEDVLKTGRAGIMIDFPRVEGQTLTRAEAQAMNMRPFFKKYAAEDVFNWRMGRRQNANVLTEVRLWESVEEQTGDFEYQDVKQIRVLNFDEQGFYQQLIFRKNEDKDWVLWDQIQPLLNGARMDFIPFVFAGARNASPNVQKPPLIDLVNANLSHYRTMADLEHGAHFTALPTAVITGIAGEDEDEGTTSYRIGSATAWTFNSPDASAKFLEFTGSGLGTLETRAKSKEEYMAFLGARMLAPEKRQAEAAETANIHRMGETSVLASISMAVSETLRRALNIAAQWMAVDGDIDYQLNRDFMPHSLSPQMVQQLFQALQGGRISHRTFFENLQRGEIIDAKKDFEEEQAEIETEPGGLSGLSQFQGA